MTEIGMCYIIKEGKSLLDMIQEARDYYEKQYGKASNYIKVHKKRIPALWKRKPPEGIVKVNKNTYRINNYDLTISNEFGLNLLWLGTKKT